MVIQIRVDDRLIHGQVALVWSKELNTPGIVVANDAAVTSDVLRMTLQMAVPTGKKLLVKSVQDAIKVFNNPKGSEMRIFALTNSVKDALELVKGCPGNIQSVNIANVGRFANSPELREEVYRAYVTRASELSNEGRFDNSPASEKVSLNGTILLNRKELEAARELTQIPDVAVFHQLIPSNTKIPIKKLIEDAKV